jgi:hypothetical protein
MPSNRDLISRVRSQEKLISGDNSITDRVVLKELKANALVFIKQQLDKRRLWETSTLFTNIPCLEMIEVPSADCCEYVSDTTFSRSKYQLPKISDAAFGLAIHGVFSADNGLRIKETTISRYINYLKIHPNKKQLFYWFYDRYIYSNSPLVKILNIWALFEEDITDNLLYPGCKCNAKVPDPCTNPLDLEFKCPGFLESPVVKETIRVLMQTYFRVPVDQTDDNLDAQVNKN